LLKQSKICGLMEDYLSHQSISKELFKMEIDNLKLWYGIKGYIFPWLKQQCAFQTHTPIEIIEKYYNTVKNYLKNRLFY
jgi:putative hydrolase of the HAD superfamily